ncbi:MAG TPA: SUMF1/EgtB/PvdO family nonheme iron enzyme [Spirochaetota bacterium]|nr:SUMF1/EgtB/PvdO family nonheme iron enzyme [Spirochaetota bacterium]
MTRRILPILSVLALVVAVAGVLSARNYDILARIESKRKDGLLTLRFDEKPAAGSYFIIEGERVIGNISVISFDEIPVGKNRVYRVSAYYMLEKAVDEALMRAGIEIGLRSEAERKLRDYSEPQKREILVYKNEIVSPIDGRKMVLVPAGKFVFGSDTGDRDEAPERVLELGDYFIDKYEVSNADYLAYVRDARTGPPRSWKGGLPEERLMQMPVLVTWMEAAAYARWANKRLPTEMEWEKAARGPAVYDSGGVKATARSGSLPYPWGPDFEAGRANTMEFWEDPKSGGDIKGSFSRGLLPVISFGGIGDSSYGAVNMAGNAPEWTADFYRAYPGSRYANQRFGTRFKVIRGGAWYSGREAVRTTRRQIGGIPNLNSDAAAGFRCVKSPALLDIDSEGN